MEIEGKVAIVTGASSGIGLATAKLLSKNGAKVALAARSKEKLEEISKELPDSLVVVADMTKENEIKEMVRKVLEHYGQIDILINNAGKGYDSAVENIDMDTFREIFALDVVGAVVAMKEVIPVMRRQGGGTIFNISSGTALMTLPYMSAYASLKRALANISLTARKELKKDKIVVSVIYPYMTATDFEKNTIKSKFLPVTTGEVPKDLPKEDTPEFVAQKILDGIKSGAAEIYPHKFISSLRT